MKKNLLLAFLFFLRIPSVPISIASEGESYGGSNGHALKNLWFPIGEKLEYRMYWGVIPVGTTKLWNEWEFYQGRKLLALKAEAISNSFLNKIFPVNDQIKSLVDPVSFLPVLYEQKLKEGKHFRHDRFEFNHDVCKVVWTSLVDGKRQEIDIDMETRDALSFAYFMRKTGFEVGKTERFRVVVDEKVYDLELTGLMIENVTLDNFGRIPALKIEPRAKFGGIFNRGGRVFLWISNDARKICLKMHGILPVAIAKGMLVSVEGPGSDSWPSSRGGNR